jgi:hypothetical protein
VRRAERVVFALAPAREAREAAALAQRADALAPAGQDLVRIGLVADVPDQPVARRVEEIVERDRQLDDAEPRPEMAAGDGDRVDRLGPELVGELLELPRVGERIVSRSGVEGRIAFAYRSLAAKARRRGDAPLVTPANQGAGGSRAGGTVTPFSSR